MSFDIINTISAAIRSCGYEPTISDDESTVYYNGSDIQFFVDISTGDFAVWKEGETPRIRRNCGPKEIRQLLI